MALTDFRKVFGAIIGRQRAALGLSTRDLARTAGLDETLLLEVEQGTAALLPEQIGHLAAALKMDPVQLYAAVSKEVQGEAGDK